MVTVVETDSVRGGYKITNNSKEGWVPSYVLNLLTSSPRRGPAWTFRKFRKPSFSGSIGRKDSSGSNSITNSPTTPSKPLPSLKGIFNEKIIINYNLCTIKIISKDLISNYPVSCRNSSLCKSRRKCHLNIL